jgi:hypothetical protein
MLNRKSVTCLSFVVLLVVTLLTSSFASDPVGVDAKPSTYAPAKDLEAQVAEFMDRIEKDLESAGEYGEDQQDRVVKNGNTLAVIALVLSNHDDAVSLKAPAAKMIEASLNLAEAAGDYSEAKSAFAQLQAVLNSSGQQQPLKWESVGDISELMLQVPILNTSLRRGVLGRRFSSTKDKSAALAATLAAIAHISVYDDTYCSDEEELRVWKELSIRMRDAAAACNIAVRAGDQDKAKYWLKELTRSCDDCHDEFRE